MPNHFVGRGAFVEAQVQQLTSNSHLVWSLEGLPGVGKTTLAVALAHHRQVLDHFKDGVLWAGLGPQADVMSLLDAWAGALEIDVSHLISAQGRKTAVRNSIGQRRLLLVIDDAWEIEAARILHCGGPNCCHILTTRYPGIARAFAGANQAESVPTLDDDDAILLLQELAPEAYAADPQAAQSLARAVGGLPLALALLGGYLAAPERSLFPDLSQAALDELADPRQRLQLAQERLGTPGQVLTLHDTIALSLEALGRSDRGKQAVRAFYALGAFAAKPATFSRAAAEEVAETGVQSLSLLIAGNLVEKDGPRLALHQTLADVARTKLDDSAQVRHREYYLNLVNADREAWQVIAAELSQIQQAWDWAVRGSGQDQQVLQLVAALQVFMERRGLRAQQRVWLERALEAARALEDRAEEGRLLGSLGLCWWQLGQHRKAIDSLENALTLARQTGDRQAEGRHLGSLGLVWASAMFRDRAIGYYEDALAIAREQRDREGEGSHLGALGLAWFEEGVTRLAWDEATRDDAAPYFRRAIAYYEEALAIAQALDDRAAEGSHLGNLGNAWLLHGDAARAKDLFSQALTIFRETGDRPNEGFHLANLGRAHHALGEVHAAHECGREALDIYDSYGDPRAELLRTWLEKIEGKSQ